MRTALGQPLGGGPGTVAPEWQLEVLAKGGDHEHLAYVFLFNDESSAKDYLDRLKSDEEVDPPAEGLKFEQRGPEVLRIFPSDPEARDIRACVDKAIKPPPKK